MKRTDPKGDLPSWANRRLAISACIMDYSGSAYSSAKSRRQKMIESFLSQYSGLLISGGCLCLCFILIPLAFFLHYTNRRKLSTAKGWASTSGMVQKSELQEFTQDVGEAGGSYGADIQYTYWVGGKEYTGRNVTIGGEGSFLTTGPAKALIARYPVGKQITVYYNPVEPGEAALEQRISGGSCYLIVGILLLAWAACVAASLVYQVIEKM
jgi:hypothetical protein